MELKLIDREQFVKDFMNERFIPALADTFNRASPEKFEYFGGNFCRQSAIIGTVFLQDLLPEYEWVAWEGEFDDIVLGDRRQYEHAWIYGKNRISDKRRILVDLTRKHQERLFIISRKNAYPNNHPEYLHTKIITKKQIDIQDALQTREFYTNLTGERLVQKIARVTNVDKFKEEFNKQFDSTQIQ